MEVIDPNKILDQPHFLIIIGSPKAGTTSIAKWLGSRSDMVLGQLKEPMYFTDFADETWSWSGPGVDGFQASVIREEAMYHKNFAYKPDAAWAIDASTDYLWRSEKAVSKIKHFSSKAVVKLICLTRDPIKRAISEYNHTCAVNMETLSFRASLEVEAERSAQGCHPLFRHQRRSRIHTDLRRYADEFGSNLLVLDHDILQDPSATNLKVSQFLGITLQSFDDIGVYNQRTLPRNNFAKVLLGANNLRKSGRFLIPKPIRHALWKGLQKPSAQVKTVTEDEINYAQSLLSDEIELCVADPLIDTSTWTLALR